MLKKESVTCGLNLLSGFYILSYIVTCKTSQWNPRTDQVLHYIQSVVLFCVQMSFCFVLWLRSSSTGSTNEAVTVVQLVDCKNRLPCCVTIVELSLDYVLLSFTPTKRHWTEHKILKMKQKRLHFWCLKNDGLQFCKTRANDGIRIITNFQKHCRNCFQKQWRYGVVEQTPIFPKKKKVRTIVKLR